MSYIISQNHNSHLIVLATPIGNLQEITPRAIDVIYQTNVFLCEDTRTTKHLLDLLQIDYSKKTFISYHKYNEQTRLKTVLDFLKQQNVVLISDAGYPAFSDPGYVVVNACIQKNIFIEVVNGANAYINALIASGYSQYPHTFYGFLDWTKTQAIHKINFPHTILGFYESVHRINQTLAILFQIFGNLQVVVLRELTKCNETHYYGLLSDLRIPSDQLKGEFVILVNNIVEVKKSRDLPGIVQEFRLFNQNFTQANLKKKLRYFCDLANYDDVSVNELYQLLMSSK